MTRALRLVSMLVLAALLLVAAAPFTDTGTRLLLAAVDRHTPVEVQYGGGRLGGRLRLDRVALTTESLVLRVDHLAAELNAGCLWRSALCFHRLRAERLELAFPGAQEEVEPDVGGEPAAGESLRLPVSVETDALLLDAVIVRWPGGSWQQGPMEASVRVGGDGIDVLRATVQDAHLYVAESDAAPTGEPVALPELYLPLRLAVDELRLVSPSFDLAGVQQRLDHLLLRGRWRQHRLEVAELAAALPEWGGISARGDLSFAAQWPLEVTADVRFTRLPAWAEPLGSSVDLAIEGDLDTLRLHATGPGRVGTSLGASLRTLEPELPFDLELEAAWQGSLPLSDLAPVSGAAAEVRLLAPLQLSASGTLAAQSFVLEGAASAPGYERVNLQLLGSQRQGRLDVEELLLRDPDGGNELRAEGTLVPGEVTQWSLHIASGGIDFPAFSGYAVGRLQGALQLSGAAGAGEWRLAVSDAGVRGEVNGLPARVSGYAELHSDLRFGASDLVGDVNGAELTLRSGGRETTPGMLDVRIQDLGRWLPGARGSVALRAVSPGLGQEIEVTGSASELDFGELSIDRGAISGRYLPGGRHPFDAQLEIAGISLPGMELDTLRLSGRGDRDAQAASLEWRGDFSGELALQGGRQPQGWRGSVAATTVEGPQGSWVLAAPVEVVWPSGPGSALHVAGHCWESGVTRICPGELVIADRSSGSLAVSGDMGFLAALFPDRVEVEGALNLAVDFAWGGGEPLFLLGGYESRDVRIVRRFSADEAVAITWERAAARVEQRQEGLYLEAELVDDGTRRISATARLPVDGDARALQGSLALERLQLATLAPLVPQLSALEGELQGQVQLSGTVDAPVAQGVVNLSGGRIAVLGNPTELASLELSLQLRGERALLAGQGILGGGEVKLDGVLLLEPEPRLEMAVSGSRQQLLAPPSTELLVSEELQVVFTEGLVDVTGEIVVHEGTLRHEELPEGSVAVSDRVVVVDYAGNVIREESPFDTRLDLWIRIKDNYQVEGGGLRATVGGDLHVVQERGRPLQIFGNLNLVSGELTAYRQRLEIRRGNISFAGNPNNPELDVRAERAIRGDNVTVGVELRGTLEEPVMTIYSDPAMEQGEAMSYLIRGRGLDAGASMDGTALALSVGADAVNQSGVLAGFDRLPGISQVQFGSEGTADDTAATVGGYIGDRLYVSYGIGIYEPITVLTARLYITAKLWLEVVSRLENSADLYYSFEIR